MFKATTKRGFSLVELVIVIVIIGVIAAIAVPRISRGAKGAADAALIADLAALRSALDLYAAEHGGSYPGATTVANQLTLYSDATGNTNATKTTVYIYGPYLKAIPGLPVAGVGVANGGKKGDAGIAAADATGVGWLYTATSGDVVSNTGTAADEGGKVYNTY